MGIGDILGIGASALSGGLFGVAASIIGKLVSFGTDWFKEKQRQEWEKEKWGYEERMARLAMERGKQETENELAIVSSQGAWTGLETSIAADASIKGTHKWVNDVKALFRPALTALLFALTYLIFRDLMSAIRGADGNLLTVFNEAEIKTLLTYIVNAVVFSATTAGTWWFGDRALTPEGFKSR